MKSEKSLFKGLKWLFSFFVGVMLFAALALIVLAIVFNLPAMSQRIAAFTVKDLPFGIFTFDIFSSPLFLIILIANFLLLGVLFYFVRGFFKNLEINQIFIRENVVTAKKIALLMVLLSITSCLPDVVAEKFSVAPPQLESTYVDPTYLIGATIIWALAKILEKANVIAEENELTI